MDVGQTRSENPLLYPLPIEWGKEITVMEPRPKTALVELALPQAIFECPQGARERKPISLVRSAAEGFYVPDAFAIFADRAVGTEFSHPRYVQDALPRPCLWIAPERVYFHLRIDIGL